MTTKATYAICLVGVVGSMAVGFGSGVWSLIGAGDALIIPLVAGPYLMIAAVAWWRRVDRWTPFLLLAISLLMCIGGIVAIGNSAYRFHAMPRDQRAMDLTAIIVPLVLWALAVGGTVISGVGSIIEFATAKRRRAKPEVSP